MTHLALFVLFLYPALTVSGQLARMMAVAMCLLCCHPSITKATREPGKLLFVWFLWAVFCSYNSDNFALALYGYSKRWEGLTTWALAISFAWLFWRTSTVNRLIVTLLSIMAVCLLFMLWKPDSYKYLISGNIMIAGFVSVASCLLMSQHPLLICTSLPFIYLTQNRSLLCGVILGGLNYLLINRKLIARKQWARIAALALGMILLAYPKLSKVDLSSLGTGARTQFVAQSVDFITMKPLMGYGIDTQSELFRPITGPMIELQAKQVGDRVMKRPLSIDRAHNIVLDILLQTGLVGLTIILFIVTRMTYRTFNNPSKVNTACLCGLAGFLGFSLFNPTGIPAIFLACLCIMGIEE